jgi:hypothetical protein
VHRQQLLLLLLPLPPPPQMNAIRALEVKAIWPV